MKFLGENFNNKNIMPLNMYYEKGEYNQNTPDDTLDIVFKDMDTGKKYVQTIEHPKIELWITKPEYRTYQHIINFIERDKCYPVQVPYKSRFKELAKILKCTQEEVRYSPYVFGVDMNIEHFYLMQFLLEYGNNAPKRLSMGFLDIENDIIRLNRFPEPGECPINVVTFIDESANQVYTLILRHCDVPSVAPIHPKYQEYEDLRNSFNTQLEAFENNLDGFIQELHDDFDESYGVFNYNILMFDNEIDLIIALFKIVRECDNDFIQIWNSPYDMQNLIQRCAVLGYDPNTVIVDERFGNRKVYFHEDKNPMAHKRKHVCRTFTMPTFIDQLTLYAGIRSARGKLPSMKLNAIARNELKDEKLDYSEDGDIKHFFYRNLRKYYRYNIKDVMLQVGIARKTKDLNSFYTTIYENGVLPNETFTSTIVIANSLRLFAYNLEGGYLLGSNKNKLIDALAVNYDKMIAEAQEEDYDEPDLIAEDHPDDEDDEDEEIAGEENIKKREKFQGAFVANPLHMLPSGYTVMGVPSKFIHKHVIDFDITSEYPTAIIIMNSSNDTMVGKVMLNDPDDIEIPVYNEFVFRGDEKEKYKMDKSNFMMEIYSQKAYLDFGHLYLGLPEIDEIMEMVAADKDKLLED